MNMDVPVIVRAPVLILARTLSRALALSASLAWLSFRFIFILPESLV